MFDGKFATEDLAFPGLWDGRIASYFPGLGPQAAAVYDWSSSNATGSLTGTTAASAWSLSQGLFAYKVNGADYMNCGANLAMQLAGVSRASLACWVYAPLTSSSWYFGIAQSTNHKFALARLGGTLYFTADGGTSTSFRSIANSTSGWSFYVANFVAGLSTVYENTSSSPGTLGTAGNCYIGADVGNANYSTSGVLYDDLAIFNRNLSIDEILTLYANGSGRGIAYTSLGSLALPISLSRLLSLRRREIAL